MKTKTKTANWSFASIAELEPIARNKVDPLLFRKQVIYAGNHVQGKSDKFTISEAMIDHWVNVGTQMLSDDVEIPMPTKHNEDNPELNRGFINRFVKAPDSKGRTSLFVFGRFADQESAKLKGRSNVSLYSPRERHIGGKTYERPITHVSFTNYPVIKDLDGFTELKLSYDDDFEFAHGLEDREEFNPECPQCEARKRKMEKAQGGEPGKTTDSLSLFAGERVFAASEISKIDEYGATLAKETGKAYAVKQGGKVLICSEIPENEEPYFCFTNANS